MKTLKIQTFTKKNLHGFTLVELIVVITILVILGTIAFTSLTGYSSNARDSDRVTTLKNIESGLDIHRIKSGSYPAPENITGTGIVNNTVLSSVGTIGDTISRIIRINKTPIDPLTKTNYTYGTDTQRTQYQIATTLENPVAYHLSPLVQTVYADASLQARVNGNYPGYIKFSSGTQTYIANIPSLLFNNTGSTNLLSIGTYFVVNKQPNLPYKIDDKTQTQNKNANEIVQAITSTQTATLTGARIDNITKETLANTFTGTLLASFGGDIAKMETVVLGTSAIVAPQTPNSCTAEPTYTDATFTVGTPTQPNQVWQGTTSTGACYYTCGAGKVLDDNACVSETCAGTTPDGTTKVSNATSFAGGTWNYNPTGAKCSYICGTNYHTEDSGATCISDTRSCTISNGVGTQTWTTSWGACSVVSCNTNYTASGTTACTDQTAPTGGDFTLPATTNSTSVTLTITCPTDVAGSTPIQMYISGAGLSNGGGVWESCTTSKNITVTTGDGSKAITMKWRDSVGNESGVVSRSVSLETLSTVGGNFNGGYVIATNTVQFYNTGTTTFTPPSGFSTVDVYVIGGGGASNGSYGTTGGGGGFSYKNIPINYSNNFSITVGKGGSSNSEGGGNSLFTHGIISFGAYGGGGGCSSYGCTDIVNGGCGFGGTINYCGGKGGIVGGDHAQGGGGGGAGYYGNGYDGQNGASSAHHPKGAGGGGSNWNTGGGTGGGAGCNTAPNGTSTNGSGIGGTAQCGTHTDAGIGGDASGIFSAAISAYSKNGRGGGLFGGGGGGGWFSLSSGAPGTIILKFNP